MNHSILHQEDFSLLRQQVQDVPANFRPGQMRAGFGLEDYTIMDRERDRRQFEITLDFAVPIQEPRSSQYILTVVSQR